MGHFISKIAKEHDTAGIFAVLPEKIAKNFPSLGKFDSSKTHVTVLFIGAVPKKQHKLLEVVVKGVLHDQQSFGAKLDDHSTYFKPSKHSEGRKIAKMAVISKELHALHNKLKKALAAAGIEVDDHFDSYKPHVTLSYLDPGAEKYEGPAPSGSWDIKEVEIWGCGKPIKIPCMRPISKRASESGGWWLSPDDKLFDVGLRGHVEFVVKNQNIFDIDWKKQSVYPAAFDKGWHRIGIYGGAISIEGAGTLSDSLLRRLQKAVSSIPRANEVSLYLRDSDPMVFNYSDFLGSGSIGELKKYDVAKQFGAHEVTAAIKQNTFAAKDNLGEYKAKRQKNTPEPSGKVEKGENKYRYVIHDHKASHHHFDLRLEGETGTLKSWALPKAKLPDKGERLLAKQVEDHGIDYWGFSGVIPEGSYGAGTVKIHSKGHYKLIKWTKSTIKFEIKDGKFTLRRMNGKNWLIMRSKEE